MKINLIFPLTTHILSLSHLTWEVQQSNDNSDNIHA